MKITIAIILLLAVAAIIGWILLRSKSIAMTRSEAPFSMCIDDLFALKTKGKIVLVGVISTGDILPGDNLCIKTGGTAISVRVDALEAFHKPLKSAKAGDRVGIMLQGVDKEEVVLPATLVNSGQR
jgi:selenocysteine-specific translation elongation factor